MPCATSPQGSRVPRNRLRRLNDAGVNPGGEYVLYWMVAARRTSWNFALQRAVDWSLELGTPLVVLEPLRCGYRWASDRHHAFILGGMAENARRLERRGIFSYPYVEPEPGAGRGLLASLSRRACLVVTDDAPVFFLPRMISKTAPRLPVLLEAVDSNGILPLGVAETTYPSAASFRRFLHRELPAHLADLPEEDPLARLGGSPRPDLRATEDRWPAADLHGDNAIDALIQGLPIDHQIPALAQKGGALAAVRRWRAFLGERLPSYGQSGRRTLDHATSGLSPYLHYGHISAHQIVAEILDAENWSPDRMDPDRRGSREGWWGLSGPAESFLDQLVTWRELGLNMAFREKQHETYDSLPPWARETLEAHAGDPRPTTYTPRQFHQARTDDRLWNAAQRQLLREGTIHNYLRMLWGKKILEWSPSPRHALRTMLDLNNRYALDGRDPNSTSGIFWILGRYDRPWFPERPIFGRIRYMSSDNTARKMSVGDYLHRYGPDS